MNTLKAKSDLTLKSALSLIVRSQIKVEEVTIVHLTINLQVFQKVKEKVMLNNLNSLMRSGMWLVIIHPVKKNLNSGKYIV